MQIAAGAFVIYSSLTIYYSIESRYKEMQDEVHALTWNIVAQSTDDSDSPPITYEQLLQLKNSYTEAMFPLHFVYPVHYPNQDNELVEAYFIYASDDYMKLMIQSDETFETSQHVYMGAEIKQFMENNGDLLKLLPDTPAYRIIDESLDIGEEAHYSIIPITNVSNHKSNSFEISIHFGETDKKALSENIVLLPLKAVYEHHMPNIEMALRLPVRVDPTVPGEEATILIMQVVSQLFSWNSAYSYNVSTQLQQFLLKMTGVKDTAVIVSVIAIVCLILVILGLTGLIHLLFNRRKQGLSILIAMGARRQDLWVSMVLESMYPALLGVGIGVLGGYYYLPRYVQLEQIEISPTAIGMFFTVAGCLLPVFLSSSTLLLRIYNMKPIKILSRE
ncbi:FtsX-like permease family protein [Paenibacillus montaniterrae]|uniref:FtsX-like permease family protein n=1 Tax=Paenibacillus montaniterrae TaxID=429341 RepID=UPI001BCD5364|nr:FtsX-like permease family protein [Paenibacillus montaniterrae]